MSDSDAFDRILGALHDAALDHARRPVAARLVDDLLGTHGSSLLCAEGDTDESRGDVALDGNIVLVAIEG